MQARDKTTGADEKTGQGVSGTAATAVVLAAPKAEHLEAEEWELSSVPNEWKPAPLFKVAH